MNLLLPCELLVKAEDCPRGEWVLYTCRGVINEVAEEKGCSSVLFFEARKRQDLYLWMVSPIRGVDCYDVSRC